MRFCFLLAASVLGAGAVCKKTVSSPCALDGTSSVYTESVAGDVRTIKASGCPNNNPVNVCVGDNPNPANNQDATMTIPATPRFHAGDYQASLAAAAPLKEVGGMIGITLNGVSVLSCYGGATYGVCTDYATSATKVEGDTFEYCGGHGNPYHYHGAPVCLIQQMGPRANNSSKQVGWAADGFPIYGNRGPNGKLIMRCGETGADAKYCADECGGYYGSDYDDKYLYRYFLMGPDSDFKTTPLSPLPGKEFFPFSPYCLLGCGVASASQADRQPGIARAMKTCTASASAGTSSDYSASPVPGVVAAYNAVEPSDTAAPESNSTGGSSPTTAKDGGETSGFSHSARVSLVPVVFATLPVIWFFLC